MLRIKRKEEEEATPRIELDCLGTREDLTTKPERGDLKARMTVSKKKHAVCSKNSKERFKRFVDTTGCAVHKEQVRNKKGEKLPSLRGRKERKGDSDGN